MRYIRINPESLEADVVASKDDKAIYIPVRRERSGSAFTDLLHYTVRFDVLYPMVEAVDRKRGVRVKYSLHEILGSLHSPVSCGREWCRALHGTSSNFRAWQH